MRPKHSCGFAGWHPKWLQKFANAKTFMIVYGLMGTTQGMAYLYFVVTLTTIEKRFKIPSGTTVIILSGNELSQIMLSLILSYMGGQRNRPKWIFWGMIFCSMSCFILALPHFIYGPGDDALQLTKEYSNDHHSVSSVNSTSNHFDSGSNNLCLGHVIAESCDEIFSIVPLLLLYISQFVTGIGQTLYLSLGQSYLDDSTRRTNTPMMLAYALSLRWCGPAAGYGLGYLTLQFYIDPTKTPLIDNNDPRWLGAWWIGWIFLVIPMMLFAFLIRLFPFEIKKKQNTRVMLIKSNELMQPLTGDESGMDEVIDRLADNEVLPKLKDFPKALVALLKNKILIFSIASTIFYILGSTGFTVFLSKYIEVQFKKSPSDATIITGPVTIAGMVTGFMVSGIVIRRYKPRPIKLFFWNVIVGVSCNRWDKEKRIYLGCSCAAETISDVNINNNRNNLLENIMSPGPCLLECENTFYLFTFLMFAVNWLTSTSRIGNILLSLRAVADKDKAFSQGLALMLMSLFAFSPGPIIFGYIIDSTCMLWNHECGKRGNCQLYDAVKFRNYLNVAAILLTFMGVIFDVLVWRHAKNLNLYNEPEEMDCRKPKDQIKGK